MLTLGFQHWALGCSLVWRFFFKTFSARGSSFGRLGMADTISHRKSCFDIFLKTDQLNMVVLRFWTWKKRNKPFIVREWYCLFFWIEIDQIVEFYIRSLIKVGSFIKINISGFVLFLFLLWFGFIIIGDRNINLYLGVVSFRFNWE